MKRNAEGSPSIDFPLTFTSWSDVPSEFLRAELSRRQESSEKPECGSRGSPVYYNTPLHVIALVIILVLSVGACSFPIIVRRFPRLPIPHRFLFLSRHFGTGVLIATAFVHLLPTAFESLTDPCLPWFWSVGYTPMPGLIAMASVLIVVGIEMFFATRGAGHVHGSEYDSLPSHVHQHHGGGNGGKPKHRRQESLRRFRPAPPDPQVERQDPTARGTRGSREVHIDDGPPSGPNSLRLPPSSTDLVDPDGYESDMELGELSPISADDDSIGLLDGQSTHKSRTSGEAIDMNGGAQPRTGSLSAEQQQKKMLLQCLLLEAGILFHSVFIGMAVSVATGTAFIVLLIAISFHQTFEGFALGSRIAALAFPPGSPKPWLMALAYGTTTPLGQAIGLAIHSLYDPASQTGLLMVGVMNAISSGLLLFAGLVELLAEDFLSDESYVTLKGRRRLEACASVVAGAALMALVGAWA